MEQYSFHYHRHDTSFVIEFDWIHQNFGWLAQLWPKCSCFFRIALVSNVFTAKIKTWLVSNSRVHKIVFNCSECNPFWTIPRSFRIMGRIVESYSQTSITPKCPRPFLSFLEFALNWTKRQHFVSFINFFLIAIVQIQTRHARDHGGKENSTISLIGWKIIMLDHEGVKIVKVIWSLSICFSQGKSKKLVTKKNMRLKGTTYITPINLQLFKIYSTNFFN